MQTWFIFSLAFPGTGFNPNTLPLSLPHQTKSINFPGKSQATFTTTESSSVPAPNPLQQRLWLPLVKVNGDSRCWSPPVSTRTWFVRLVTAFLLLAASSTSKSLWGCESLLSNEMTEEKNNPTKIDHWSAKALPLPLDLVVIRREADNGWHKLQTMKRNNALGHAWGGDERFSFDSRLRMALMFRPIGRP